MSDRSIDAVALMRSIREQMAGEYAGLTWEERARRIAAELADDPVCPDLFGEESAATESALPPDDRPPPATAR